MSKTTLSPIDKAISALDLGLKTLTDGAYAAARTPAGNKGASSSLDSDTEKKHIAGLMRINHTGEVCAQALYQGQALTAKSEKVRHEMKQAADEEIDHLVWCEERLKELDSRPSLLNPLFYGMSFGLGAVAGSVSDEVSLGFVAATEEQVCKHLESHLTQIPESDQKTRRILTQMLDDEAKHATQAHAAGAKTLPFPIKLGMKAMAKVMTTTTYKV